MTDHVPETEDGYDVVEVVSEPLHVVRVVAGVEACRPAFLCEVVGGHCQEVTVHDLAVRDPVGSAGVNSPPSPVLGGNVQTRINWEDIFSTLQYSENSSQSMLAVQFLAPDPLTGVGTAAGPVAAAVLVRRNTAETVSCKCGRGDAHKSQVWIATLIV